MIRVGQRYKRTATWCKEFIIEIVKLPFISSEPKTSATGKCLADFNGWFAVGNNLELDGLPTKKNKNEFWKLLPGQEAVEEIF